MEAHGAPQEPQPAQKFGTFLGVYTPSVLTILGVMMYLRFGWVVGNAGLPIALLIVLMASSITFITGLSASAIATNMKVGVGGEYFMVSRSLGLELGGAIGIPLFLCRTFSLTLYAFGLAETLGFFWPESWGPLPLSWLAASIIVLITAIAGKSAALSLKLQIPIMVAVGLSMLALFGGTLTGGLASPEMVPHYERSAPGGFWYVFAVFFPAVTGFTAGIGLSGDLKDPKRSIPIGTLLAVATGAVSYLLILAALAFTGRVSGEELAHIDPEAPPIWTRVAWLGAWLVFPGMWGAILSSAFGSALGGPRVLQALAVDGLAPRALGRVSKTGQPTVATWVAGAIALAAVALGDLNTVGRWVTIFFLTLYVTINFSAALESLVGDPSYRPTIRVPWYVSLLGSAGAIGLMLLISPWACLAAIVVEVLIYLYLRRRSLEASFGDVRAGMWNALVRFALLKLKAGEGQARNWRPLILAFTSNPATRMGLVKMANWFNQNRGLVTVCQAVVGDLTQGDHDIEGAKRKMDEALEAEGVVAFTEVDVVPEFESGIIGIAQANGFAGLHSNTVLFGWPDSLDGVTRLLRVTRALTNISKNVLLVRLPDNEPPPRRRRIDIWWRGMQQNGDLMLLLAHLLRLNTEWSGAEVHLRTVVDDDSEREPMLERLRDLVSDVRIPAECDVIVRSAGDEIPALMHRASRDADIVFLGVMAPAVGEEEAAAERLDALVGGFGAAILVRAADRFAGQLVQHTTPSG